MSKTTKKTAKKATRRTTRRTTKRATGPKMETWTPSQTKPVPYIKLKCNDRIWVKDGKLCIGHFFDGDPPSEWCANDSMTLTEARAMLPMLVELLKETP